MNHSVVVDASVAIKWVIDEPYTSEALARLSEWSTLQTPLIAPSLLFFEVANAIYKRLQRGEFTPDEANLSLAGLLDIGIITRQDRAIYTRAIEIAHQFTRPSSYDAHYLALAELEGCEFWTADERLWNTVREGLPWVRWIGES